MLSLTIAAVEQWNEATQEFIHSKEQKIQIEHSLVSLSKWESTWLKPFLSSEDKTYEETIDYIRCMTITQNVDPSIYNFISRQNVQEVRRYIEAPMTATTVKQSSSLKNREVITAEILYYRMIVFGIPFECQKWHLNRLLTLINVADAKSKKPKKMPKKELMDRNRMLNEQRRKQLNTKG